MARVIDEVRWTGRDAWAVRAQRAAPLLVFALIAVFLPAAARAQALDTWVTPGWAAVPRYLAVHPGTTEPVWESADRSLITNGLATMQPVGDGSYEAILELNAGASYNFLFFAKTGASPPQGLSANYTYYDAVPGSGMIGAETVAAGGSISYVVKSDTWWNPARYGPVGQNFDARRLLTVPASMAPGETLVIYANFGGPITAPRNFDVFQVDTRVALLSWDAPSYNWGDGYPATDVIAGGTYVIMRSHNTADSFAIIDWIPGYRTSYEDSGLTVNDTYYYAIYAEDAYLGTAADSPFLGFQSETTAIGSTRIQEDGVRAFFIVYNLDWDYVSRHRHIVYLTRTDEIDKYLAPRRRAVIGRVRIQ